MENKAVFLDRDGVINKCAPSHEYITSWEDFELLPDVIDSLKLIKEDGYLVIVISNQRGVARGKMTAQNVEQIHAELQKMLNKHSVAIDAFYYCPHNYDDNCVCRKPAPGMLLQAAKDYNVDLSKSWFIGDSESDVQCGEAAGVKTIKIEKDSSMLSSVKEILN